MRMIELANAVKSFELNLTARYLANGDAGFASETERLQLQRDYADITMGRNRLEWITDGATEPKYFPSMYVTFAAERSPIEAARVAAAQLHQAFLLGTDVVAKNIYIGKYQGITRASNSKTLMLSLRGLDCRTGITHDQAVAACRANGTTHHCTTQAEYAYIALLCKAMGFQPHGNVNYGKDESGNYGDVVLQYTSSGTKYFGRVAQGSGPLTWFHDGSPLGIWGLNGNVYEWAPGYRIKDGYIQIIPFNEAALAATDLAAASTEWMGMLVDGTLETPVDASTTELKFGDATATGDNVINISGATWDGTNYFGRPFTSIEYSGFPALLKELAIIPHDAGNYGGDYQYFNFNGERCPFRGGHWSNGSTDGVFYANLTDSRSGSYNIVGARPAFYEAAA